MAADTAYVFVGPYARWLAGGPTSMTDRDTDRDRLPAEPDLMDDGRLYWLVSYLSGRPPQVERDGRMAWVYCCGPLEPRPGAPRSPMLIQLGSDQPERFAVADWLRVDREAEVAWFRRAFAAELAELESRWFLAAPEFGWGLLGMWS